MPVKPKKQTNRSSKPAARKRGGSVLDRIGGMQFDDSDGIKINLYGRSGTGKTTLWGTFPGRILAIICSGTHSPGELRSINTPRHRKKVDTVTLEDPQEILQLCDHVRNSGKYTTVVLDHGSGLQDLIMKDILGLDSIPAQGSWGMATREQWGMGSMKTKELLREVLSLAPGCNVVIVAQEREFSSDDTDEIVMPYVASALMPAVTGWLNYVCDYIGQTFIRQRTTTKNITIAGEVKSQTVAANGVEYCLRTEAHPVFTTKFRIPKEVSSKLPDVIVDPSYDKIIKLINGG